MKKLMMILAMTFGVVTLIASDGSKKNTIKCDSYMDKYNDYIGLHSWIELKYADVRKQGTTIVLEGEYKQYLEQAEKLYAELIKELPKGPYVSPPAIPKVCWYCRCLSYFCGKYAKCGCYTSINCVETCPSCGLGIISSFNNGVGCNSSTQCADYDNCRSK